MAQMSVLLSFRPVVRCGMTCAPSMLVNRAINHDALQQPGQETVKGAAAVQNSLVQTLAAIVVPVHWVRLGGC